MPRKPASRKLTRQRFPWLLALAAVSLPHRGDAREPEFACPSENAIIISQDQELAAQTCQLVSRALDHVGSCHLHPRRPVHIAIVEQVSHPLTNDCLALADCATDTIEITAPAQLPERINPNTGYADLNSEVVFESLLVHELTHLIAGQILGPDIAVVDQEYMAYAMQFGFLAPDDRETLMSGTILPEEPDLARITEFSAMIAPLSFATYVWQHFESPAGGCDLIQRILSGEETLHRQVSY